MASYGELDNNKALGGRLWVAIAMGDATLTLGLSGYTGRNTESDLKVSATGLSQSITQQYDELSLAGDLLLKWKGLHLQSEFFSQQIKYSKAGLVPPALAGPHGGVLSDYLKSGGYTVLGYRFSEFPLMPYVEFDLLLNGGSEASVPNGPSKVITFTAGLNYRPLPTITLKAQYGRMNFIDINDKSTPVNLVHAVAAWSF
jgi:hypothetical protein